MVLEAGPVFAKSLVEAKVYSIMVAKMMQIVKMKMVVQVGLGLYSQLRTPCLYKYGTISFWSALIDLRRV